MAYIWIGQNLSKVKFCYFLIPDKFWNISVLNKAKMFCSTSKSVLNKAYSFIILNFDQKKSAIFFCYQEKPDKTIIISIHFLKIYAH